MNSIRYCVWVRKTNGNLFLWRRCEFLASARYYAGVARDKETEALISTWEKSEAFIKK